MIFVVQLVDESHTPGMKGRKTFLQKFNWCRLVSKVEGKSIPITPNDAFRRSCNKRYFGLKKQLLQDKLVGVDNYPTKIQDCLELLSTYCTHNQSRNTRSGNYNNYSDNRGNTPLGFAQIPANTTLVPGTDGQSIERQCYRCGNCYILP